MENSRLTGHQAHPLQPVPEASDEEEDLGSRKEARTLLICSYVYEILLSKSKDLFY